MASGLLMFFRGMLLAILENLSICTCSVGILNKIPIFTTIMVYFSTVWSGHMLRQAGFPCSNGCRCFSGCLSLSLWLSLKSFLHSLSEAPILRCGKNPPKTMFQSIWPDSIKPQTGASALIPRPVFKPLDSFVHTHRSCFSLVFIILPKAHLWLLDEHSLLFLHLSF